MGLKFPKSGSGPTQQQATETNRNTEAVRSDYAYDRVLMTQIRIGDS